MNENANLIKKSQNEVTVGRHLSTTAVTVTDESAMTRSGGPAARRGRVGASGDKRGSS